MKIKINNWLLPIAIVALAGCSSTGQYQTAPEEQIAANPTAAPGPAPVAVTDPAQPVRAFVRAVHTVRGVGPVSLAIDGEPVASGLAFSEATSFIGVPGEKVKIHSGMPHQITVLGEGDKVLGGPLAVDLERGEDVSVVVGGSPGKITLSAFEHTNRGSARDAAKIAVLHTDPTLPEVTVLMDNKRRPGDIGFGELTGYQRVAPGAHTLKVMYDRSLVGIVDADRVPGASPPPPVAVRGKSLTTLSQSVDLRAGKVYSVLVYADANGRPALRFLEDKFEPTLIRAPEVGAA